MSIPATPSYRKRIAYHTGLLGFFSLMASTALMMSYLGTKEDIALRMQEDLRTTLGKVIPAKLHDNDMSEDQLRLAYTDSLNRDRSIVIYVARKSGEVAALAYQVIAQDAYAGPIIIMMGINTLGEILGVRIISHSETPGLGDKIEIKKDKWILSFDGLSIDNTKNDDWTVKKDGGRFDQFTGATITPRAVIKAVRRGLEFFENNKSEILSVSAEPL